MKTNLALELRLNNWLLNTNTQRFEPNENPYIQVTLSNLGNLVRNFKDNSESSLVPITLTSDILLKAGFEAHETILFTSYSIDISKSPYEYKVISIMLEPGNVYVYLRSGEINEAREKDILITLFNGDKNGKLYLHWLQNIYQILTGTELNITLP